MWKGAGEKDMEATEENGIGTTSATSRPMKRVKNVDKDDDSLVGAFERGTQTVANAIIKVDEDSTLPDGLFECVDSISGFELELKSKYYSWLVDRPFKGYSFC